MMDPAMSNGPCDVEKYGHKDSKDNLDGIRSIMVEQETRFKEQVQELHRVYEVQKLEMQELGREKNRIELETADLTDGFSSISNLGEKYGALVRPVARVYKPESGSLSLHPFCSLKLFEGSGSVSFGGSFQRLEPSKTSVRGTWILKGSLRTGLMNLAWNLKQMILAQPLKSLTMHGLKATIVTSQLVLQKKTSQQTGLARSFLFLVL